MPTIVAPSATSLVTTALAPTRARARRSVAQVRQYLESHKLEEKLNQAVQAAVKEQTPTPLTFIADYLNNMAASDVPLNILLQEDLIIRGGAQLWLMNCGSRLAAVGHKVTFAIAPPTVAAQKPP